MLTKVKTEYNTLNRIIAENGEYCEPDCDTSDWECSPDYCTPDAYNVCDPDCSDGSCDPSDDDW